MSQSKENLLRSKPLIIYEVKYQAKGDIHFPEPIKENLEKLGVKAGDKFKIKLMRREQFWCIIVEPKDDVVE